MKYYFTTVFQLLSKRLKILSGLLNFLLIVYHVSGASDDLYIYIYSIMKKSFNNIVLLYCACSSEGHGRAYEQL